MSSLLFDVVSKYIKYIYPYIGYYHTGIDNNIHTSRIGFTGYLLYCNNYNNILYSPSLIVLLITISGPAIPMVTSQGSQAVKVVGNALPLECVQQMFLSCVVGLHLR